MDDLEQLAQEAAIWPWLESDCMADDPADCSPVFFGPDYLDDDNDEDC